VDEILDEVKEDRLEFMAKIKRAIGKNETYNYIKCKILK
jgi:hypothetical protein